MTRIWFFVLLILMWSDSLLSGSELNVRAHDTPHFRVDTAVANHPTFANEVAHGSLHSVLRSLVVFKNGRDKAVTGIAVRYIFTDNTEQQTSFRYLCESYLVTPFRSVVEPGKELLIGPGVFLPEALASKGRIGVPNFSEAQQQPMAQLVASARAIDVEIDSVLYADGGVVGPNTLHLPEDIVARNTAAKRVLQKLETGKEQGRTAEDSLKTYVSGPLPKGDLVALWLRRFSRQSIEPSRRDMSQALAGMTEPPVIYTLR